MFTKKKIAIFIAACVLFLAADVWMFSTVKSSFGKTMAQTSKTLAQAIAKAAPADEAEVAPWLEGLAGTYKGYSFYYYTGIPGEEGCRGVAGDEKLPAFWQGLAEDSPERGNASDSVNYL